MTITPTLCQNMAASALPFERDCLPEKTITMRPGCPPQPNVVLQIANIHLAYRCPSRFMEPNPAAMVSFAAQPADQLLHSQYYRATTGS